VELAGIPASVDVVLDQRSVQNRSRLQNDDAAPAQVFLNLEDIQGERNPAVGYEVFVQVGGAEAHYVGNVSFFGIEHTAARGADVDGPHGMRRTFDITSLADTLRGRGEWDDQRLTVAFRPLGLVPPDSFDDDLEDTTADDPEPVTVQVGRVSVFYS
jgi:tyrosinase